MSTVTVSGPFTTTEIRRIVALMQDIESMRPDEAFAIHADMSDIDGDGEEIFAQMDPPPLPGYQRTEACSQIEHHYRITWRLPDDDVTVKLGMSRDKEVVFDGADGQRRAREMLDILRQGEKTGLCSDIAVAHRVASSFKSPWQDVQEVDQ